MTDYKKAFVDTAPFIYFIEKDENNPQYYGKVKKFFSNGYEADKKFVTSVITMEEYFVFPYRKRRNTPVVCARISETFERTDCGISGISDATV